MSNIDKQQIRADIAIRKSMPGFGVSPDHSLARLKAIQGTQRSFGLEVVEALLDELEAKDNRINRLEAIVAVAEQRNALMREWKRALKVPCDLVDDQVPVVIHGMVIRLERLKETEAKLEAAKKRIAELEAREVVLPQPAQWDISEVLLDKGKVVSAIRAAGIRINGEG